MLHLNHNFSDNVELSGEKIPVDLAFGNVLEAFRILSVEKIKGPEKIFQALSAFGIFGVFTLAERAEMLEQAFKLVNKYSMSVDRYNYPRSNKNAPILDFTKDTGLIYSAFLQSYGIDLFNERKTLHWAKFITLLNNIPENTRLSKVMGYRAAKIPPADKYNRHEVMRARELKNIYRLDSKESAKDSINNALSGLFGAFGGSRDRGKAGEK